MMKPVSLVGLNVIAEMCEFARDAPPGCFVEVGVYKGGTAWHLNEICKRQHRELYLFDTFTGIPYRNSEAGDSCLVGDFSDTSKELVKTAIPEAVITKGIFPDSAAGISPQGIAFVHLDCDQYQSYRDSISYLSPLMVQDGLIWFDDYCLNGAKKAIDEAFGDLIQKAPCGKTYVRISK